MRQTIAGAIAEYRDQIDDIDGQFGALFDIYLAAIRVYAKRVKSLKDASDHEFRTQTGMEKDELPEFEKRKATIKNQFRDIRTRIDVLLKHCREMAS